MYFKFNLMVVESLLIIVRNFVSFDFLKNFKFVTILG